MPYGTAVMMDRMMSNNPMQAFAAYADDMQKNMGNAATPLPTMDRDALIDTMEQYLAAMEKSTQSLIKNTEAYNAETLENLREVMGQTREMIQTVLSARDFQAVGDVQEDFAEFMFEALIKQSVLNYQHVSKVAADIWTPWNTVMRKSMKGFMPTFGG